MDTNNAKDMHCNICNLIEDDIFCPKIARDNIFRNANSQFAHHGQALPNFLLKSDLQEDGSYCIHSRYPQQRLEFMSEENNSQYKNHQFMIL